MQKDILAYHKALSAPDKAVCDALFKQIVKGLPEAEYKIWHRSPVWFLEGNPIVGYHKLKDGVRVLFWSGQSFKEKGLTKEGTFKAADVRYATAKDIDAKKLARWLKQSRDIQWDYGNIMKNKGLLPKKGLPGAPKKHRIYSMVFGDVYPMYFKKAKAKGRTKAEMDEIIRWLTGYTQKGLEMQMKKKANFEQFFADAPKPNPKRKLVTGVICGVRIEEIEDPLMREVRYMDKLVDELAKGRPMEKILRQA